MTGNDLTHPLGVEEKKPVRRLPRIPFMLIGGIVVASLFAGLCTWLALVDDPMGGEPMAIALIEPEKSAADKLAAEKPDAATVEVPKDTHAVAAAPDAGAPPVTPPSGGQVANESGVIVVRGFPPAPPSGASIVKAPDATTDGKVQSMAMFNF